MPFPRTNPDKPQDSALPAQQNEKTDDTVARDTAQPDQHFPFASFHDDERIEELGKELESTEPESEILDFIAKEGSIPQNIKLKLYNTMKRVTSQQLESGLAGSKEKINNLLAKLPKAILELADRSEEVKTWVALFQRLAEQEIAQTTHQPLSNPLEQSEIPHQLPDEASRREIENLNARIAELEKTQIYLVKHPEKGKGLSDAGLDAQSKTATDYARGVAMPAIRTIREAGITSLNGIANALNRKRVSTPKHGKKWYPQTVKDYLTIHDK